MIAFITVHMTPEFARTLNHRAQFDEHVTDVVWHIPTTEYLTAMSQRAMHGDREAQRIVTPLLLRSRGSL